MGVNGWSKSVRKEHTYYVAPFKRRPGSLEPRDLVVCEDEDTAFRRGRAMMERVDGLVFFRIETAEDGDVWSEVELLATVGDVPAEAA